MRCRQSREPGQRPPLRTPLAPRCSGAAGFACCPDEAGPGAGGANSGDKKGGPTQGRPNLTNHHYKEHLELTALAYSCYGVFTPYSQVNAA